MDYNFKKKKKPTNKPCVQRKLIHCIIPYNYEMTGWYKNIYLGLSILCISKVSSKKTRNIPKTQKMIEKNLINLRTMKKTPSSTAIPKKHSKTERGFLSQIKASQIQ